MNSTLTTPIGAISVKVDQQTPESWGAVVGLFADACVYQSWAYGAIHWNEASLSHLVMSRDGEIVAAAQLRVVRMRFVPGGIAYLRWGPMCQRKDRPFDPSVVPEMIRAIYSEYCDHRGLSLQLIPNVFVGDPRADVYIDALQRCDLNPRQELGRYRTMLVDLTPSVEALRKNLDQKWRNQLNRAEKNGLTIDMREDQAAYEEFTQLYREMWAKKQFETSVDIDEFARMQSALPASAKMKIFLARKDGQPVGALVCSLDGNTAIYLLGATNDLARDLKAAYLLQWQAMTTLKSLGAQQYDLGGIDPETNPGGFHFKEGFGGRDVTQLPSHAGASKIVAKMVLGAFMRLRLRRQGPAKAKAVHP